MQRFSLALAALLLTVSSPVLAKDGPYLGVQAGAVSLQDAGYQGNGTGLEFTADHDSGLAVGGVAGYRYGKLRGEFELTYRQNDWDDVIDTTLAGVGRVPSFEATGVAVDGETRAISLMVNGYYDFQNSSPFTPYLMAGIGGARIGLDGVRLTSNSITVTAPDEDETVLAYQAGGGLAYSLSDSVSVSLDYRYFAVSEPDFSEVKGEYNSHNLMLGFKFHF